MSEPTPTGFKADKSAGQITVAWDTGEIFDLPFVLLRNACPCAQCRGGHENMQKEPADDVFIIPLMSADTTKLVGLAAVGNYAIKITWGDGHDYGIYNWHYLYTLCKRMEEERMEGKGE
jgi:DUF971 family protein